jgi:myo-inositol-1(or 4)-monophosphatase
MYDNAIRIARDAGQIALGHFRKLATVPVESKGHLDLVTLADKEVEAFLIRELRRSYPDDGVFGEEGGDVRGTSGRTWVIDPIDGTFNFVRGSDQWMISVGLYENRAPAFGVLHAPVRDRTYVGGNGISPTVNGEAIAPRQGLDRSRSATNVGFHPIVPVGTRLEALRFVLEDARMVFRSCGSCTISLMEVAEGVVDGYIGMGESSWDLMAALAILQPLGVTSTVDWSKVDLDTRFRFAAGTPEFLDAVAPLIPHGARLELPATGPT